MSSVGEELLIPFVIGEEPDLEGEASTELLYERLQPLFHEDSKYGFFGRTLCGGIMAMLQGLDQIVIDTPTHPGWCKILDPAACPASWLPWCAALYGVTLTPGSSPDKQRAQIEDLGPQKRGTPASLEAAALGTLGASAHLSITERSSSKAYRITMFSSPTQSASEEARTLAAILTQKPGGILLTYSSGVRVAWDEATKEWKEAVPKWSAVKHGEV